MSNATAKAQAATAAAAKVNEIANAAAEKTPASAGDATMAAKKAESAVASGNAAIAEAQKSLIDTVLDDVVTAAQKTASLAEAAKEALTAAIAKLGTPATAEQIAEVEAKKALAEVAIKEAEAKLAAAKAATDAALNKIDPTYIESANAAISKGAATVADVATAVKASNDAIGKAVNTASEAATNAANEASGAASAVNSAKTELEAAVSHIGHPATDAQIVDVTLKEQALRDAMSNATAKAQAATAAAAKVNEIANAASAKTPASVSAANSAAQSAESAVASGNAAIADAQVKADRVANAIFTIGYCAENNNAASLIVSASVYVTAGVQHVDATNFSAINSALDSISLDGTALNTVPKIQAVVDAYNAILAVANGIYNGINPTQAQYATLGIAGVDNSDKEHLLGDVLDVKQPSDINRIDALQALADDVAAVMSATPAQKSQVEALGIRFRAFTSNALSAIAAETVASNKDTASELQDIVNTAIRDAISHLDSACSVVNG
jgi:hypothetical protein